MHPCDLHPEKAKGHSWGWVEGGAKVQAVLRTETRDVGPGQVEGRPCLRDPDTGHLPTAHEKSQGDVSPEGLEPAQGHLWTSMSGDA